MALTLIQAAEQAYNEGKERLSRVMLNFATSSSILPYLPLYPITGGQLEFTIEEKLPNVGTRGYNEGFSEGTGEIRKVVDETAMLGVDLKFDTELINGNFTGDLRGTHEQMSLRALSLYFDRLFVKGDRATDPKEFNGLQARIASGSTQYIAAGSTSGGDALSLAKLAEARLKCRNATHWIMNPTMYLRLEAASRNASVSGYINYTLNQMGSQVMTYAGLPIIVLDQDNNGDAILDFTEANPGGGTAASTSVYLVSFAPSMNGLGLIESTPMQVKDLGESPLAPVEISRVTWRAGITVFNPRSVVRIAGVKDAAIVA